jgi:hypothetical protein
MLLVWLKERMNAIRFLRRKSRGWQLKPRLEQLFEAKLQQSHQTCLRRLGRTLAETQSAQADFAARRPKSRDLNRQAS